MWQQMQTSNEWWHLRRRKEEVVFSPLQRRTCSPLLESWRIHMIDGIGTKKNPTPGYQSPISSTPSLVPCLEILMIPFTKGMTQKCKDEKMLGSTSHTCCPNGYGIFSNLNFNHKTKILRRYLGHLSLICFI